MSGVRPAARFFTVLLLSFALAACVQVEEPALPSIEIPEGSGTCSSFCECAAADLTGRVFRLTRLEIDEPDAFAQLLNTLWEGDIRNNILNVIFVVDEAVAGTTSAFKTLSITVGPGWRVPKMPYVLKAEEGLATETAVDDYCQLEGLSEVIDLKSYHGYQCTMKSVDMTALYFHSGPKDAPLICAPQNQPANNIPIKNLKIRATFNRDCSAIPDGFLEGCITMEDADRICMCPGAPGSCPMEGLDDPVLDPDRLSDYCHDACGQKWTSFGGIIRAKKVEATCLTPEGLAGYRVQGFFEAVAIPGQYNPVASDDCSVH